MAFPLALDTEKLFSTDLAIMMKKIFAVDGYGCRASMFELKNGRQKVLKIRSNSEEKMKRAIEIAQEFLKPVVLKLGVFDFTIAFKRKYRIWNLTSNFNVYIEFDFKNNAINIYQRSESSDAKKIVTIILQEIRNSNKDTIQLKHLKSIIGNKGKALKELQEKYDGRIDFDYRQKTISINSTNEEEITRFKQEINALIEAYEQQLGLQVHSPDDCPICYGVKEKPILLSCGHSVCRDCFTCQLEEMTFTCCECDHLLTIPEINSSQDLTLIDKQCQYAVEKFLEKHSENYRHCSFPHCSGILSIDQQLQTGYCVM